MSAVELEVSRRSPIRDRVSVSKGSSRSVPPPRAHPLVRDLSQVLPPSSAAAEPPGDVDDDPRTRLPPGLPRAGSGSARGPGSVAAKKIINMSHYIMKIN